MSAEPKLIFRVNPDRRDVYDRSHEVVAENEEWFGRIREVEEQMGRKWIVQRSRMGARVLGPDKYIRGDDGNYVRVELRPFHHGFDQGTPPPGWVAFKSYDYLKPVRGSDGDDARALIKSLDAPIQLLRLWVAEYDLPEDSMRMLPPGEEFGWDHTFYEWGYRLLDDVWYLLIGGGCWDGNEVFQPIKRSEWYALLEAAGVDE